MKIAQKIAIGYVRARLNMLAVLSPSLAAEKTIELFSTPKYRSNKTPPEIFSKGERIHFLQNGKRVKGYRWNEGAGKKLLILHGYESSCRKFDHHISRGIKKGYEVFAFDALAHGSSEGKKINALDYAEMIRLVEKHYGTMNAFICHSFGGMALSLYLETIKHDHNTKMVLIAPATETTTAIDGMFSFLQLNNKVRKEFDKKIKDLSGHPPSYYSIARAIKHIKASVLWVHDKDDLVTPLADVRKIMEAAPSNIEFMITEGLGHNKINRDTEVKRRVFSFL